MTTPIKNGKYMSYAYLLTNQNTYWAIILHKSFNKYFFNNFLILIFKYRCLPDVDDSSSDDSSSDDSSSDDSSSDDSVDNLK
jgi:hypothetical protein